jgi:hypothetical protein
MTLDPRAALVSIPAVEFDVPYDGKRVSPIEVVSSNPSFGGTRTAHGADGKPSTVAP